MCYRIHIKRADENLKVKNQVLIRTEFSKLSQLFSWIPRCSKLVKARKRAKRGYCIQGLYILRIILLLMLFLDILYVKDNGWLFSPLFSYFINIYNYKTYFNYICSYMHIWLCFLWVKFWITWIIHLKLNNGELNLMYKNMKSHPKMADGKI